MTTSTEAPLAWNRTFPCSLSHSLIHLSDAGLQCVSFPWTLKIWYPEAAYCPNGTRSTIFAKLKHSPSSSRISAVTLELCCSSTDSGSCLPLVSCAISCGRTRSRTLDRRGTRRMFLLLLHVRPCVSSRVQSPVIYHPGRSRRPRREVHQLSIFLLPTSWQS